MSKIAIVIHGGAGYDSEFIRTRIPEHEEALKTARDKGYAILEKGGSSVDAVEAAVKSLEDNPLFNSGCGSALNAEGKVEMCTSIMEGRQLRSGAATLITAVKNPIAFAKSLMEASEGIYVGGKEASDLAKEMGLHTEDESYFVTRHQVEAFEEESRKFREEENGDKRKLFERGKHGTVGAVAVDIHGNVAAGTSTGGTNFCLPGRIGDTSMIGVGTYADNRTAAISGTGEGEYLIRETLAGNISAAIEYAGFSVQQACDHVIHVKNKNTEGNMGVIAVDKSGNIGVAYNSARMHRAWKTSDGKEAVKIYE